MANFSQSFTGRGTAVVLPESGALKSQEGLNAMVVRAEELRYKVYDKNRNEFLQNANIDPVFVLSDSARKYQIERINDFNKIWGKRAQETNYNLSDQDKLNMQTHKNLIMSEQQDHLAQYKIWEQQRDLIEKDGGVNYSSEDFYKATLGDKENKGYMGGDRWDYPLQNFLRPKDFGMKLREIAMKQPNRIPNITKERPSAMIDVGMGEIAEEYYTVAEDQVDGLIASVFANYPAERKDAFMKWESEDKAKYDYDILKWLKEKYSAEARPLMTGAATTKPGAGRAAASTAATPVNVAGAEVKLFPGQRVTEIREYGDQTYSNKSFAFGGNTTLYGIPTKGYRLLEGDDSDLGGEKGSVNGRLVLYDPIKHVFVMELGVGSESAGLKTRVLIEIPETNIQGYNNIPLLLEDGSKITVNAYRKVGGTPATPPPASVNPWEQYKRK